MNIKLITSTIEKAKIQGDTVGFVSAIFIFFAVKKCCIRIFICITRFKEVFQ